MKCFYLLCRVNIQSELKVRQQIQHLQGESLHQCGIAGFNGIEHIQHIFFLRTVDDKEYFQMGFLRPVKVFYIDCLKSMSYLFEIIRSLYSLIMDLSALLLMCQFDILIIAKLSINYQIYQTCSGQFLSVILATFVVFVIFLEKLNILGPLLCYTLIQQALHISNLQTYNMQTLEKYNPFKSAGDDFADSNPIFSYYFYQYYLNAAENILKSVQDAGQRKQIQGQIKEVYNDMGKMQNKSTIKMSQEQNMVDTLQYTELMFAKNQHQFSQNFRSKQLAQDFLTIHRLYEVVKHFHGLNEQQDKRRVFAKKRFIDIMKQLKNQPEKKPEQLPPPPPPPKPIQQKIKQSVFKAPLPKPSQVISYDKIQMQIQANKRLENAISELSFDRFKFAKEEVLHALQLLEQLCQ